jgi:hypothetical protein
MQGNISHRDEGFDSKQFKDAIVDYKNWMTGGVLFLMKKYQVQPFLTICAINHLLALISLGLHVPLTSFLFFLPTFIQSMGFSTMTSQLMTIPPYLAAFAAILVGRLVHLLRYFRKR